MIGVTFAFADASAIRRTRLLAGRTDRSNRPTPRVLSAVTLVSRVPLRLRRLYVTVSLGTFFFHR